MPVRGPGVCVDTYVPYINNLYRKQQTITKKRRQEPIYNNEKNPPAHRNHQFSCFVSTFYVPCVKCQTNPPNYAKNKLFKRIFDVQKLSFLAYTFSIQKFFLFSPFLHSFGVPSKTLMHNFSYGSYNTTTQHPSSIIKIICILWLYNIFLNDMTLMYVNMYILRSHNNKGMMNKTIKNYATALLDFWKCGMHK